jgi:hypothetical protein
MAKKKWGKKHFELWRMMPNYCYMILAMMIHKNALGENPMRQSHAGCNASKHHRQEITQFCNVLQFWAHLNDHILDQEVISVRS